jgi:hypothetical protein
MKPTGLNVDAQRLIFVPGPGFENYINKCHLFITVREMTGISEF